MIDRDNDRRHIAWDIGPPGSLGTPKSPSMDSGFQTRTRNSFGALEIGVSMLDATGFGSAVFVLGVVAANLPDVDAAASIPRRLFGKAGLGMAAVIAFGAVVLKPSLLNPVVGLLLSFVPDLPSARIVGGTLVVGGAVVGATVFGSFFDDLTKHRGIWHHPFFGVGLGVVAAVVVFQSGVENLLLAGGLGLVVAGGFLAHFVTDWVS